MKRYRLTFSVISEIAQKIFEFSLSFSSYHILLRVYLPFLEKQGMLIQMLLVLVNFIYLSIIIFKFIFID